MMLSVPRYVDTRPTYRYLVSGNTHWLPGG